MANDALVMGIVGVAPWPFQSLDWSLKIIVEIAATYLFHSTLLLGLVWLADLIAKFKRTRTKFAGFHPAIVERLWKSAAMIGIATAPISVLTGFSRPAYEWSLSSKPILEDQDSNLINSDSNGAAMSHRFQDANASRHVSDMNVGDSALASTDTPIHDEQPAIQTSHRPNDPSNTQSSTNWVSVLSSNNDLAERRDDAGLGTKNVQQSIDHPKVVTKTNIVVWVALVLLAWIVAGIFRLVLKAIVLHRWISKCHPAPVAIQAELGRIEKNTRVIRLLSSRSRFDKSKAADKRPRQKSLEQHVKEPDHDDPLFTELTGHVIRPRFNRTQETLAEPFACGVWRWTIVLPVGVEKCLSREELRALLAHEMAHLHRRDPSWQWVGEVLCTCLAFQPLNFLVRRRWQQASELLCDDWAVEKQIGATCLANCLSKIVEWRLDNKLALMGVPAIGASNSLSKRIEWLLREGRARETKRPHGRVIVTLIAFSVGLWIGSYGPRLSLSAPLEAANTLSNISWNEIDNELASTLVELSRIKQLANFETDAEISAITRQIDERIKQLQKRQMRLRSP